MDMMGRGDADSEQSAHLHTPQEREESFICAESERRGGASRRARNDKGNVSWVGPNKRKASAMVKQCTYGRL